MPTTIAFAARKGGVGKTSLLANIAAFFANDGSRVLLIGCDAQDDLADTYLSGVDDYDANDHFGVAEVLSGDASPDDVIFHTPRFRKWSYRKRFGRVERTPVEGEFYFDIMPSGGNVSFIETDNVFLLRKLIRRLSNVYDFIFLDLPPSDANITILSLAAADYVIVPVTDQASFKSVKMVTDMLMQVRGDGATSEFLGAVINMDSNTKSLKRYNKQLFLEGGDLVFNTTIREGSDIANAAAFGIPICAYQKTKVLGDIYSFYMEIRERIGIDAAGEESSDGA